MEQNVGNLSGGNQQKVLLAKWMFADPDILILDEPTRGIDVGAKYEIYDLIIQMAKQGKTIIVSTHIFSLVEKICDRVGIIINGRMAACEDLRTLCGDKSLEDRFFEIYEAVNGEEENHDK